MGIQSPAIGIPVVVVDMNETEYNHIENEKQKTVSIQK